MNNSQKKKKTKNKDWYEIKDQNGLTITEIVAITTFKDGLVVATKDGLYTNVKSLIK